MSILYLIVILGILTCFFGHNITRKMGKLFFKCGNRQFFFMYTDLPNTPAPTPFYPRCLQVLLAWDKYQLGHNNAIVVQI